MKENIACKLPKQIENEWYRKQIICRPFFCHSLFFVFYCIIFHSFSFIFFIVLCTSGMKLCYTFHPVILCSHNLWIKIHEKYPVSLWMRPKSKYAKKIVANLFFSIIFHICTIIMNCTFFHNFYFGNEWKIILFICFFRIFCLQIFHKQWFMWIMKFPRKNVGKFISFFWKFVEGLFLNERILIYSLNYSHFKRLQNKVGKIKKLSFSRKWKMKSNL